MPGLLRLMSPGPWVTRSLLLPSVCIHGRPVRFVRRARVAFRWGVVVAVDGLLPRMGPPSNARSVCVVFGSLCSLSMFCIASCSCCSIILLSFLRIFGSCFFFNGRQIVDKCLVLRCLFIGLSNLVFQQMGLRFLIYQWCGRQWSFSLALLLNWCSFCQMIKPSLFTHFEMLRFA